MMTWPSFSGCCKRTLCVPGQARVEAAGGQILFWNGVRVMGVLAVSRAIGDHCLRPFVIAQPEVRAASFLPALSSRARSSPVCLLPPALAWLNNDVMYSWFPAWQSLGCLSYGQVMRF